jgi:hypothetical protein
LFNSANVNIPEDAEGKILNMTNEGYVKFYNDELESQK